MCLQCVRRVRVFVYSMTCQQRNDHGGVHSDGGTQPTATSANLLTNE